MNSIIEGYFKTAQDRRNASSKVEIRGKGNKQLSCSTGYFIKHITNMYTFVT